jgi:hypothetical protein
MDNKYAFTFYGTTFWILNFFYKPWENFGFFFLGVNSTNFAKFLEKDSKFSLSHFFNNLNLSIKFLKSY